MVKGIKRKKTINLTPLFAIAFGVVGLVFTVFLVAQPKNLNTSAAVPASSPPISLTCSCGGSAACTKLTTSFNCISRSGCKWTCPQRPTLTLLTPNGGEVWERGKTYQITWNQSSVATSTALALYTRSASGDTYLGAIAYYVSNVIGKNSYSWTVPLPGSGPQTNPPDGSNIIISVAQFDSSGKRIVEDKRNSAFTIVTPKPKILTPNGGEVWERGKTYQITWNQSFASTSTGLFLFTRGPSGDTYLGAIAYWVSNVVGKNSYSWTIPMLGSNQTNPPDGSNIIVSVGQYDSSNKLIIEDKSDSTFTVVTK
jgi:hypothetical protein